MPKQGRLNISLQEGKFTITATNVWTSKTAIKDALKYIETARKEIQDSGSPLAVHDLM